MILNQTTNMKSEHKYDICIIGGLGHVGLALGLSFAKAGKKVIAFDINQHAIDVVSKGRMPFTEKGGESILHDVLDKTFFISNDKAVISRSYFIIVVIGTPVDEHLNPEYTLLKNFFAEIIEQINDNHHIILRSTIYPGSTEKIHQYLSDSGKSVRLSFCPERVAQGSAIEEIRELPQIISAFDETSLNEARNLFLLLTNDVIILEPLEAELAKIFSNVWRYIQFSIANQFYQIATENKVDFYKIFDAITYKYPRMRGVPGAGFAAGPCLFKDTMQLASFANNTFFLGHSSMLVNEGLPNFIVQMLKKKFSLSDKTVGILGMAFKANNDDPRESLSYKLKKILEIEAKEVLCSDIYIEEDSFTNPERLIKDADIIILGTPHNEYREYSIGKDKTVVDIWNFWGQGGLF